MEKIIQKAANGGIVPAIPSKSMAHRMMIALALSDSEYEIKCKETSVDIEATRQCLIDMLNSIKNKNEITKIDCKESGSTLRFLLPIAGALGLKTEFYMEGRLPNRPLSPLYEEMQRHGCIMSEQGSVPFCLEGKLSGGDYEIAGNISSQFITGLIFALPLCESESRLHVIGKLESRPYVDMSLYVLKRSGIIIEETDYGFRIPGNQKYMLNEEVTIEGDWSNSAFWLCLGAISDSKIQVSGLNINSKQGDKKVVDILREFGAEIEVKKQVNSDIKSKNNDEELGIYTSYRKTKLKGITIDAEDIPDLIPILSVVGCAASGTTKIINAKRLRLKESDRLSTIKESLCNLGAEITETEDGLIIEGKGQLNGGEMESFNDHRIAMMGAVAAAICKDSVKIKDAEAVAKSYPGFYKDYETLGGKTI